MLMLELSPLAGAVPALTVLLDLESALQEELDQEWDLLEQDLVLGLVWRLSRRGWS